MKITIIGHNLWGIGGTVRTIYNMAAGLSTEHDVHLVSVLRKADVSAFRLPLGVTMTTLLDARAESIDRSYREYGLPSIEIPQGDDLYGQYSMLSDIRLREYLQKVECDVVIGTRPGINIMLSRFCPSSVVRIAQEHGGHEKVDTATRNLMRECYPRLSAVVALTKADADLIKQSLSLDTPATPVAVIPNSVPAPHAAPSSHDSRLIVAAGRVVPGKRFELLIHAFAALADEFPDWNARIYGSGSRLGYLRELVQEAGLVDRVRLMGNVQNMGEEWTKAAIAVSTSDAESFGMTIVEAMRAGVPLISTDCPTGPREIITNMKNGILIPKGNIEALTDQLRRLMSSPDFRQTLSIGALERGSDFAVSTVARQHADLFNSILARRKRANTTESVGPDANSGAPAQSPGFTVTAFGKQGGNIRFVVDRSDQGHNEPLELILGSSHKNDPGPTCFPVASRSSSEIYVESEQFRNDALWNVDISLGGKSVISDTSFYVDNREIINSQVPYGRIRHAVPFVRDNELFIQAWKRDKHAEVRAIEISDQGIRVETETAFSMDSDIGSVVLTRRADKKTILVAVTRPTNSRHLAFHISFEDLLAAQVERHEDWDVTYQNSEFRSKVAKLLDDIADHKPIDRYPARLETLPLRAARDNPHELDSALIRPYYTPRQNLAISVALG